ncbi:MAG: component of SufBCD complex [Paracoccaceae bacterium]
MRQIAAIRTNKWTEEEERLMNALLPVFGDDLVVVFHDRPAGVTPPLPVIDLQAEWVLRQGLALVPDWGWRCGDYFYYALHAARPDYDYYWMVEPDVHFTGPAQTFFEPMQQACEDALGFQLGPFNEDIRFARGLPGMAHYRAIFALTRFSGRALGRLLALRQKMAEGHISMRDYPNDELFCFSHIAAMPELAYGCLETYAPEWFEGAQFTPNPDLLYDVVVGQASAGKLMHPVRSRANFKRAVAKRLAANSGFLIRMRQALDQLSDEDVEEIVAETSAHLRGTFVTLRRQRALQRHRGRQ